MISLVQRMMGVFSAYELFWILEFDEEWPDEFVRCFSDI